jgi:hypothetical protein
MANANMKRTIERFMKVPLLMISCHLQDCLKGRQEVALTAAITVLHLRSIASRVNTLAFSPAGRSSNYADAET